MFVQYKVSKLFPEILTRCLKNISSPKILGYPFHLNSIKKLIVLNSILIKKKKILLFEYLKQQKIVIY